MARPCYCSPQLPQAESCSSIDLHNCSLPDASRLLSLYRKTQGNTTYMFENKLRALKKRLSVDALERIERALPRLRQLRQRQRARATDGAAAARTSAPHHSHTNTRTETDTYIHVTHSHTHHTHAQNMCTTHTRTHSHILTRIHTHIHTKQCHTTAHNTHKQRLTPDELMNLIYLHTLHSLRA